MVQPVFLALASCALVLSACTQTAAQADCHAIPPPAPGMLYPLNGAAQTPDSFTLVLTYAEAPIKLQSGGSIITLHPTAMPSPLPTPNAGPAYNNAAYSTGILRAHTTYNVLAPVPHCESAPLGTIGSFTTS